MNTKLTEHEMLVTLANMALKMDDLTGHDVVEALKAHGFSEVVIEARKDLDWNRVTKLDASVSLKDGAAILAKQILSEQDQEERTRKVLSVFQDVQKVAIHEAAICLKLGGLPALYRLFGHHGIRVDP